MQRGWMRLMYFQIQPFNRDGWRPGSYVFPVVAGTYIGMVRSGMVRLLLQPSCAFVLAVISDERLEFLICAICSFIFFLYFYSHMLLLNRMHFH